MTKPTVIDLRAAVALLKKSLAVDSDEAPAFGCAICGWLSCSDDPICEHLKKYVEALP